MEARTVFTILRIELDSKDAGGLSSAARHLMPWHHFVTRLSKELEMLQRIFNLNGAALSRARLAVLPQRKAIGSGIR